MAPILAGFGCRIQVHDPYPNEAKTALGVEYTPESASGTADIITLHSPLTPDTYHLINDEDPGCPDHACILGAIRQPAAC